MESKKTINLKLKVWRQKNAQSQGQFETYDAKGVSTDASFLEMLDGVNESLIKNDQSPITIFDCARMISN